MNPLDFIKPYTTIIAAVVVIALLTFCYCEGYSHAKKAVQADWDKEKAVSLETEVKATQASLVKERASAKLVEDTQTGGSNAIKLVLEWYKNHPNIKYVQSSAGLPIAPTGADCSWVPEVTGGAGVDLTKTTNDGSVAKLDSEQIQVEPQPLERCAETTIQALECRNYVLSLTSILNKE